MKKIYNILMFMFFSFFSSLHSYAYFWFEKVDNELIWDNSQNLETWITNLVLYLLWFIWLIGIIFAMYAGFQILTAAWDDEKVKSWKKTLLFALLWIFIILIAYFLVNWVINGLEKNV